MPVSERVTDDTIVKGFCRTTFEHKTIPARIAISRSQGPLGRRYRYLSSLCFDSGIPFGPATSMDPAFIWISGLKTPKNELTCERSGPIVVHIVPLAAAAKSLFAREQQPAMGSFRRP